MNINEIYSPLVAKTYEEDRFDLLKVSRQNAIRQIQLEIPKKLVRNVFDIGAGTGMALMSLKEIYPKANFSGIENSPAMASISRKMSTLNIINKDANELDAHIQKHSQDLILIHFVLAYINPEKIFKKIQSILKPGGYCSIATTTYDSFKKMQELSRVIYTDEQLKSKAKVPDSSESLENLLTTLEYEIVQKLHIRKKVYFENFNDFFDWGIKSAWLTQFLSNLPVNKIRQISDSILFPLSDEFVASIYLVRKC